MIKVEFVEIDGKVMDTFTYEPNTLQKHIEMDIKWYLEETNGSAYANLFNDESRICGVYAIRQGDLEVFCFDACDKLSIN